MTPLTHWPTDSLAHSPNYMEMLSHLKSKRIASIEHLQGCKSSPPVGGGQHDLQENIQIFPLLEKERGSLARRHWNSSPQSHSSPSSTTPLPQ